MKNPAYLNWSKFDKLETFAFSSSILVISAGAVYWSLQIKGVMEMLKMAYG